MGDLDRLSRLLDRLHRLGRITTRLPIFVTEYGYETNPPDVERGVTPEAAGALPRPRDLPRVEAAGHLDVRAVPAATTSRRRRAPRTTRSRPRATGTAASTSTTAGRRSRRSRRSSCRSGRRRARSPGSDVVVLFGQVRPSEGRKRIEVEMRGADGTWIPIQTYETRPAGDVTAVGPTSFLTDARASSCGSRPTRGRRPTARAGSRPTARPSTACVRSAALLADDDLHPHLARMVLAQDLPGPDLAERGCTCRPS